MIGKLKGVVDEVFEDYLILDVAGVGYKVFMASSALFTMQPGIHAALNIDMYVREDQISLYGFADKEEQKWFNILQKVQGVGAKVALAIIGTLGAQTVANAIVSNDQKTIKSIPGIGPKLADRIINELKNNKDVMDSCGAIAQHVSKSAAKTSSAPATSPFNDALNALANLGFARADSMKVLSEIVQDNDNLSLEDMIRLTLSKMGPK